MAFLLPLFLCIKILFVYLSNQLKIKIMTEEQFEKAGKLQCEIYKKEETLKGLNYCLNDEITQRNMHISVNGLKQNQIEIDEKHFKTISKILYSLTVNDLSELKEEFKNL